MCLLTIRLLSEPVAILKELDWSWYVTQFPILLISKRPMESAETNSPRWKLDVRPGFLSLTHFQTPTISPWDSDWLCGRSEISDLSHYLACLQILADTYRDSDPMSSQRFPMPIPVSQLPMPSIICRLLFEPKGTLTDPEWG